MPRLYSWALMTYLFPKRSVTLFRTMRGKVCLVSLCFVSWLKHSFAIVGKSKPVLKLSRECSFGTSNVAKNPSICPIGYFNYLHFQEASGFLHKWQQQPTQRCDVWIEIQRQVSKLVNLRPLRRKYLIPALGKCLKESWLNIPLLLLLLILSD